MHDIKIILLVLLIYIFYVNCEQKVVLKSKNILPYFRRKVEEVGDGEFSVTTESEDSSNLVSFLVKNVREIFDDIIENSEPYTAPSKKATTSTTTKTTTMVSTTTTETKSTQYEEPTAMLISALINNDFFTNDANISISNISTSTYMYMNDMLLLEHLSLTTLLDNKLEFKDTLEMSPRKEVLHISKKDLKQLPKTDKKEREISESFDSESETMQPVFINNTESETESTDPRRSCIMCNNVGLADCNDPKNKLIPSIMCERDDDLCYSLHTPFGIVDRGCFNVNHNVTTYVCSCNLCNHVSISEMPFMFSKKQDWLNNVIELSRTKHFRKSVFQDMSCLRCEVNTTTRAGDMLDSANCLEGNIGNLPVEQCEVDEVCAVKALRANGYIWRGCVKAPLYNYWMTLCDQDLCNYDTILSLHDFLV